MQSEKLLESRFLVKVYTVSEIKSFMAGLFSGTLLEGWELRSLELSLLTHMEIDGVLNPAYLPKEEGAEEVRKFVLWQEMQPKVRALLAGGKAPTSMTIALALPKEAYPEGLQLPDGHTPLINLRYISRQEEGKQLQQLSLITGMSIQTFSLDKTPERLWDEMIPTYFRGKNILLMEENS